ncbi:MAG TPA: Gfo/Idh/MocA family oxidoreductase [Chloroflexota bacterium]
MDHLGIAVIGLGVGRRHLEAYRKLDGVEVVAVATGTDRSADEARDRFGVPFSTTDYRRAIDRPEVDAVSVCSPDRFHAEQAAFALERGKHVLVEKPIATTQEDVARLVELADASGRCFMAGHNYRFMPQFVGLRESALGCELGRVYLAEGSYVQDLGSLTERGPGYWRFADPQDFFLGAAVHLVDFLRWVGGEVAEVHAYANHAWAPYPGDENYVAALRFASGAIGQVVLALGSRRTDRFRVRFALHGTDGAAEADNVSAQLLVDSPRLADASGPRPVPAVDSFAAEVAEFVRALRQGGEPAVSVRDGARAVAICLAAIRSAGEGRPAAVTPV